MEGRKIGDNILLCQELMLKYDKVIGNHKRYAIKIDLLKAYDMVNWDFLKLVLIAIGVHPTMISWIMVCVTTPCFFVCINRGLQGFFKSFKGLR